MRLTLKWSSSLKWSLRTCWRRSAATQIQSHSWADPPWLLSKERALRSRRIPQAVGARSEEHYDEDQCAHSGAARLYQCGRFLARSGHASHLQIRSPSASWSSCWARGAIMSCVSIRCFWSRVLPIGFGSIRHILFASSIVLVIYF